MAKHAKNETKKERKRRERLERLKRWHRILLAIKLHEESQKTMPISIGTSLNMAAKPSREPSASKEEWRSNLSSLRNRLHVSRNSARELWPAR